MRGYVNVIDLPTQAQLDDMTKQVLANNVSVYPRSEDTERKDSQFRRTRAWTSRSSIIYVTKKPHV